MKVKRKTTRHLRVWRETGEDILPRRGDLFCATPNPTWPSGVIVAGIDFGPEQHTRHRVILTTEPVTVEEEVDCPEWIVQAARLYYKPSESVSPYPDFCQSVYSAWVAAGEPKA